MSVREDWEMFYNKYKPILNHLDDNASFDGFMFETFDDEIAYVEELRLSDPKRVWTIIEGDGVMVVSAGYHIVNRLGYIITEVHWDDENEEYDA